MIPDAFFGPLPDDELEAWKAGDDLLLGTHVPLWWLVEYPRLKRHQHALSQAAAQAIVDRLWLMTNDSPGDPAVRRWNDRFYRVSPI